jgi:hypothetical protein
MAIPFLDISRNKESFRSGKDKLQIFGDTGILEPISQKSFTFEGKLGTIYLDDGSPVNEIQRTVQGCSFCLLYFRPILLP